MGDKKKKTIPTEEHDPMTVLIFGLIAISYALWRLILDDESSR